MNDESKEGINRRNVLRKSTSIGIIGFSLGSVQAQQSEQVHFSKAGYKHEVDFTSLSDDRYRPVEDLFEEALERAGLSEKEASEMSKEELDEKLEFPGDRSKLINPSISGVHVEVPPTEVKAAKGALQVTSTNLSVSKGVKESDVIVKQASTGIGEGPSSRPSEVTTHLAGSLNPIKGYSVAPDTTYRPPEFDVRSAGRNGELKVQTGKVTKSVHPSEKMKMKHSKREVELELRCYDGSRTTASVEVKPELVMKNHGKVPVVRGGGRR